MKRAVSLFLICFLLSVGLCSAEKDFVLVIDAGHGGRDVGAYRGKIYEKKINLAVALQVGKLIESNIPDVKVVYTRKDDKYLTLHERAKIANKNKANLFISIHTNATGAKSTTAVGAETYILGSARSAEHLEVAKRENSVIKYEEDYETKYEGFDPDSPESYIIFEFMTNQYIHQSLDVADKIQSYFKNGAKRADRGVRQAGLLVLRETSMPAILIELGFINNLTEAKYLNSDAGQRTMANAIYNGFKKYKEDFDKKVGVTATVTARKEQPQPVESQTASISSAKSQENTIKEDKNTAGGEVEYRVQFYYSPTKLSSKSSKFKGLKNVSFYVDNGYKYTAGSTTDYDKILKVYKDVKKKFPDAFIIRMKDGKRIK